jgi:hypothetical protein
MIRYWCDQLQSELNVSEIWLMDPINALILERELLKIHRDSLPNGFYRNEATKEIARLQRAIQYYIRKSMPRWYREMMGL